MRLYREKDAYFSRRKFQQVRRTIALGSMDYRYALTHIDVIEKGDSIHIFLPKSSKYFNSYRINTV